MSGPRTAPGLDGVPETALWTLYHRAAEATRGGGYEDPVAVQIVEGLDYPFRRRFGVPTAAIAARSLTFDRHLEAFLQRAPAGQVVCLGEGLETQRFRVDNGRRTWLTVDLPEALAVRERFIAPDDRHVHWPGSAADGGWLERVDPSRPCFITAQGLLMYLPEAVVRGLLTTIAGRAPGAWMMFDTVPPWVRWWTEHRWPMAIGYAPPPMRWSIRESEQDVLRSWVPTLTSIKVVEPVIHRPAARVVMRAVRAWPTLRRRLPAVFKLQFGPARGVPPAAPRP